MNGTQPSDGFFQRHRLAVILIGVVAAVIVLAAFISTRRSVVPIRVEQVTRQTITSFISTNGKIEPVQNFEAHAPGPATVKSVLVHEGDPVRAGQLLVQLDDAEARAAAARALAQLRAAESDLHAIQQGGTREEVLTTQAQLAKAQTEVQESQRNLDALKHLQQTGAASAGEVQAAENRLARAQTDLQLLQQKQQGRFSNPEVTKVEAQVADARSAYAAAQDVLKQSNITAPRAGTVYSLPVRAGMFVNTGDLLVQVADLHKVMVRAFVDEPDIGRLRKGEPVQVTWDALPGRTWEGTVTSVPTTVALRGTRTVGEVTCEVDNRDLKLLPNVNVTVEVITARDENALTVAREAVHEHDGHTFVYQVVNNELKETPVQTSIANLTRVEVAKGLEQGMVVALGTANGQMLKPGQPIRVVRQ
jgi:HlyD family secretion protein